MSRKSSTDDYRFKSSMFCKNGDLWIRGSNILPRDTSPPVSTLHHNYDTVPKGRGNKSLLSAICNV